MYLTTEVRERRAVVRLRLAPLDERMLSSSSRTAARTEPVPRPWTTRTSQARRATPRRRTAHRLARLLRALAAHVELVGDVAADRRVHLHGGLARLVAAARRTQPRERDPHAVPARADDLGRRRR